MFCVGGGIIEILLATSTSWFFKKTFRELCSFSQRPRCKVFYPSKLEGLKNGATVVDKISAMMIKIAMPIIVPSLWKQMNCSLQSVVFPKRWKPGKVTPLYKAGDCGNVTL